MPGKTFSDMPKIDLHCHIDGSMTLQSVRDILGRDVEPSEIQAGERCGSLANYLGKFNLPLACIQTEAGLKKAAREFLLALQKDRVCYVEARFAPESSTEEGLDCKRVMEAVLTGLEEAKRECGIHYQVIACMMRHHGEERNLRMLKACREFLGDGLCAVDLAGDEAGFPLENFYGLFEYAKKLDYPFTIHAGECKNASAVLTAVQMGAGRIGHGIAMAGRPEIMEECRRRRIGVEMCPVSNYQTGAVGPGETYPLREFLEHGLLATINTDNRTVSNTSISREMEFLQEKFDIIEEELRICQRNAIETAFADDAVKHEIWKLMQ